MTNIQQNKNNDNHDMSVFELTIILWNHKWLILVITFLCTVMGFSYLQLVSPAYQATAVLEAPPANSVLKLNIDQTYLGKSSSKPYDAEDIYSLFINILMSKSFQEKCFNQIYLPTLAVSQTLVTKNKLYEQFLKSVIIKKLKLTNENQYMLSVESRDPGESKTLLKNILIFAQAQALVKLQSQISEETKIKLYKIQQDLDWTRELGKKYRLNHLSQLQDALITAKAMSINSPVMNDAQNYMHNNPNLFLLGTKALESEINILRKKEIDNEVTPKIQALENEYNFYSQKSSMSGSLTMYQLVDGISAPNSPHWPKKELILMLSIIGGLILGAFMALFRGLFLSKMLILLASKADNQV